MDVSHSFSIVNKIQAEALAATTTTSEETRRVQENMESGRSLNVVLLLGLFLIVTIGLITNTNAQITFSKDWNAGKRNLDTTSDGQHNAMKSANALCHLLINQIRRLSACDLPNEDIELAAVPIFAGKL